MSVKINMKGPIISNDMGRFYHWIGWDACCPNDVSTKLEEANGEDVILEINSPGGYCDYGFEIYTMLMEYPGKVTAHVITAASAASLPVCAADEALMSDAGIFMIHNCSGGGSGDYRDMQSVADALAEYNEAIINVYVRKTGKSREELQDMMDNETYMSTAKAIENGFVDDYMFGNPNEKDEDTEPVTQNNALLPVASACIPLLPEDKAKELMLFIQQNRGDIAASDREETVNDSKKGDKEMTLEEMMKEHPELEEEIHALIEEERKNAVTDERARLKALDDIASSVTSDALHEAKYGTNIMDAKELAYQALMQDGKLAANYMKDAVADAEQSGVNDVGVGNAQDEPEDESVAAADWINKRRGGKL